MAYSQVASEYYDPLLHPTCADFRAACFEYLRGVFRIFTPQGRIADIGCGQSLLTNFVGSDLVLIDASEAMLTKNDRSFERRLVDLINSSFGTSEFDWIFGILADPYNVPSAWQHIQEALKESGQCIFIVPSYEWASKFRHSVRDERDGFAKFDLSDGSSVYLPSVILPRHKQIEMIRAAGLQVADIEDVRVDAIPSVRSEKITRYLRPSESILDVYRVTK